MTKSSGSLFYSPWDLIRFLENPFVTWMDRYDLECPGEVTPDPESEEDQVLFKAGLQHEQAVLEQFQKNGVDILQIPPGNRDSELTVMAMREGRGVIYQAFLQHGQFAGY